MIKSWVTWVHAGKNNPKDGELKITAATWYNYMVVVPTMIAVALPQVAAAATFAQGQTCRSAMDGSSVLDPRHGLSRQGPSYTTVAVSDDNGDRSAAVAQCAARCCADTRCAAFRATDCTTMSCTYTLDSEKNAHGQIRGGSYFYSTSDTASTASIEACAALCCNTVSCGAFSLNTPWTLSPWLGCLPGKPCCSLAKVAGPFEKNPDPVHMNITTGVIAAHRTAGPSHVCCSLMAEAGDVEPNTGTDNITSGVSVRGANATRVLFSNAGSPADVSPEADCDLRLLAWQYGLSMRPDEAPHFQSLYDALQLAACPVGAVGVSTTASSDKSSEASVSGADIGAGAEEVFISLTGSDVSGTGAMNAPFKTPQRGVQACREIRALEQKLAARNGSPSSANMSPLSCTVTLRNGTYRLAAGKPLMIEAADSFLTVRSFPGEAATLSGAVVLDGLSWERAQSTETNSGVVIWRATVPSALAVEIPGLRVNGRRAPRARYPNIADIESVDSQGPLEGFIAQQPPPAEAGWGWIAANLSIGVDHISTAADWPDVQWIATQTRPAGSSFGSPGVHTQGTGGGTCDQLAVSTAYFCGSHIPRGNSLLHRGPAGLRKPEHVLPNARHYHNVSGAVIHMWRTNSAESVLGATGVGNGLWGTLQWEVSHRDANGSFIFNPAGGTQAVEGFPGGGAFFIENQKEELDHGSEWYYDTQEKQLYYVSNETDGRPPANGELEAVVAESLVVVRGTKVAPVRNVTLSNLSLRDTVSTFLQRHENPSGGDWGLVHSGAVVAHGTEGFAVQNCHICRVDGQGLVLDGYTRGASILHSTLNKIGSHGIVLFGKTSPCLNTNCSRSLPPDASGPDGRGGTQPIGTVIAGNIISETGVYERHGTMIFSSLSAQTSIQNNVLFNAMRAAVNINDGVFFAPWLLSSVAFVLPI
jgi:hypothetical protein